MNLFFSVLLAISLSMDSFSVSFVNGLTFRNINRMVYAFIPLTFALIQGLMFFLGWIFASSVEKYFEQLDHWIAFGILSIIGLNMIFDFHSKVKFAYPKFFLIIIQGFATSIDAVVVGFGIGSIVSNVFLLTATIGISTFVFSIAGLLAGNLIGKRLRFNTSVIGGVILIGIGFKILIDHLIG